MTRKIVFSAEELLEELKIGPQEVIFWDEVPFFMHKARPPPDPWAWFEWRGFLELMEEDLR